MENKQRLTMKCAMTTEQYFEFAYAVLAKLNWPAHNTYFYVDVRKLPMYFKDQPIILN